MAKGGAMPTGSKVLLRAALRRDLASFIHRCFLTVSPGDIYLSNWHIEAIAHQLERVLCGESQRLIINIPPRHLKSICVSVALPAYVLGLDPSQRIVCVSYSIELAKKHARDCRAVMESVWYKELFPNTRVNPKKNTEVEFETTVRGGRLATSVSGTLTGRGGNLIIIDDPLNPKEAMSESMRTAVNEWFDSTLSSRLDQKTQGAIVLVMQRLHCDDLVGHLLDRDPSGWEVLRLPAIAEASEEVDLGHGIVHRRKAGEVLHPEREPKFVLDQIKRDQTSLTFSAQYQQAPVPPGGALIRRDWFRSYSTRPVRQPGDLIVQSWDTASRTNDSNDWSACTTWLVREQQSYLLDVLRARLEFPDLRREIISRSKMAGADYVLIEDAGAGMHLIQDLNREGHVPLISIRPVGEKIVRLQAATVAIEGRRVWLPESADWLADFLVEVLAFPRGRFDDQVDSLSQFLNWAANRSWEISFEIISL